jgi:hypothetical protein
MSFLDVSYISLEDKAKKRKYLYLDAGGSQIPQCSNCSSLFPSNDGLIAHLKKCSKDNPNPPERLFFPGPRWSITIRNAFRCKYSSYSNSYVKSRQRMYDHLCSNPNQYPDFEDRLCKLLHPSAPCLIL